MSSKNWVDKITLNQKTVQFVNFSLRHLLYRTRKTGNRAPASNIQHLILRDSFSEQ